MTQEDFKKIIDEYPLEYCHFLEAVYGRSMMSEGGAEAIDKMFQGVGLQDKLVLDIGSGLGGMAVYLAEKYQARVIGVDINAEMLAEANQRIPNVLQDRVSFQIYEDTRCLPFPENYFDIVCSKGVLVHLKDKLPLLKEVARILKPNGSFVLNDWLSPKDGHWGDRLKKMCEVENLTLYAVSSETYKDILREAGLLLEEERDETDAYAAYNAELVQWLLDEKNAAQFRKQFGEVAWHEAKASYRFISESMKARELFVKCFVGSKVWERAL